MSIAKYKRRNSITNLLYHLNIQIVVVSSILLLTCWHIYIYIYISLIPQTIFFTVYFHFKANTISYMSADGGHLVNWRPNWNHLNIRTLFISLSAHYINEQTIHYQHLLFRTSAAIFMTKVLFWRIPWWPSWKMAAILKFCVACVSRRVIHIV